MPALSVFLEDIDFDGSLLVTEIESYLATHSRVTAHPLVTKTTEELVREALGAQSPAPSSVRLPGGLWRILPDWALPLLRPMQGGTGRRITVDEHLMLTAAVLERWGWDKTPGHWRTLSGRRCLLGAQAVLFRLGYGDEETVDAAGRRLNNILQGRGIRAPYWDWNDDSCVSREQVFALIHEALGTK